MLADGILSCHSQIGGISRHFPSDSLRKATSFVELGKGLPDGNVGSELNMPAMMELLRAFSGFTRPSAKGALPALEPVIAQARPRESARTVRQ